MGMAGVVLFLNIETFLEHNSMPSKHENVAFSDEEKTSKKNFSAISRY